MLKVFRNLRLKKLSFAAGAAVALALVAGTATVAVRSASAADCDSNAIIYCGFETPGLEANSGFIQIVHGNNSRNGHNDLQAVYAHQFYPGESLPASQYMNFANKAVAGTAYKDGRIVVNGQTVATGTSSVGRELAPQGSGAQTYAVGGTNYYGNVNAKAFATDGLPVYVLFDGQGTMEFAVLKSCGNPIFGPAVKTSASCNSLKPTPQPGVLNGYTFSAVANLSGNAKLTKCVYNFGDGSATRTVSASGNTCASTSYTYTKAGNFTASVVEYASVPGNGNLQLPTVSMCTHVIPVKIPFGTCTQLMPGIIDKSKYSYSFTATASYGNGATFTSGDFDFGDGNTQNGVKPTTTNTITVTHTYAKASAYNISALLHFTENGKLVSAQYKCTASVSPTAPPAPTCKPGIPVGDVRCNPCPTNPAVSADDTANCQTPPPTLPSTGAGNTIAIFAAVAIIGFLVYRQLLFRRHRAAFVAAEQGSSALPLADPLATEQPLAGTPLQPAAKHRRSFRRKRQY